jgi:aryl-alcohol dehydrogenase-like predicted oxidoreductase
VSAFPARVEFGPSKLSCSPLAVASSYGLGARGVEHAFERGVNTFYWGSWRRRAFGRGLKTLCARRRDELVVIVQTYTRVAALMRPSLESALRRLGIERVDLLLLGYWNGPISPRIRDAALALRERGLARALMVSCHHRPSFAGFAADPALEALMVRYNAAHPGAEQEVFPNLSAGRPGVAAYTATSWGHLLEPDRLPPGLAVPSATDCYRFSLSHPTVDLVMSGPRDEAELAAGLETLERGPLDAEKLAWMRQVGAAVHASERNPVPWLFALRRRKHSPGTRPGA